MLACFNKFVQCTSLIFWVMGVVLRKTVVHVGDRDFNNTSSLHVQYTYTVYVFTSTVLYSI